MANKWLKENHITDFDERIQYDYDTLSGFHTFRMYEWSENKDWKKCKRKYIVADSDLIYNSDGEQVTFEESSNDGKYYIINPSEIACNKKSFILNYFEVKSLADVKEKIPIKNLRFAGVPLIFTSEENEVDYDFIFDALEDAMDEKELYPKNGILEFFLISQARAVFASLYRSINLPTTIPKSGTVKELFGFYDILHQFSEKYEEVSSNPDDYSKKNFNKVHKLSKTTTKEEWDAIIAKKGENVTKDLEKKVKKISKKIYKLEEIPKVKIYADLFDKLAVLHEKKDKKKNETAMKILEDKMNVLLKVDEKVVEWANLTEKMQDYQEESPKVSVDTKYMKEILEKESQETLSLLLTEFLPENDIEDEETEEEDEGDNENDEEEPSGEDSEDYSENSEEEDESLNLSDDSQYNVYGDEIVDFDDDDEKEEKSGEESEVDDENSEEELEKKSEKKFEKKQKKVMPRTIHDFDEESESDDDDFEEGSEEEVDESEEENEDD